VIRVRVLDEPMMEFGYSGTHQEQRAGLAEYGPADVEMLGRADTIRLGSVGAAAQIAELQEYLRTCAKGVDAKETQLVTLFPEFPGTTSRRGFHCRLAFPAGSQRAVSPQQFKVIRAAEGDDNKIRMAVDICAEEVRRLLERTSVDVVLVVRPPGLPDGVGSGALTGANFHDLLKAALITTPQPIQIIRPSTWRGGPSVEDDATRAWNLFTALYYKAGGKPWRLLRKRSALSRLYVGVSFTRSDASDQLFASVAQVFNELGDGVIVRGGLAERSQADRQPHLAKADAKELLSEALRRYRDEHRTSPAAVTLHKTSDFSEDERDGFMAAAEQADLDGCELLWLTDSENAMLIRGSNYYPPLRGTLLSLSKDEHVLYSHGSVPFYKTYPGLYVPRPLGIRTYSITRSIEEVATEILSLTKLNWNRARMDARLPITLLTAKRVGGILRHVDASVTPAPRYANYM